MSDERIVSSIGEQSLLLLEAERHGQASAEDVHEWMTRSTEHLQEVLFIALPQHVARQFSPETRMELLELIPSQPVELPRRKLASNLARPLVGFLAAAAVVALFVFGLAFLGDSDWQHYETRLGQSLPVTLPDGSRVVLNTETQMDVRMSSDLREVRVLQGEALFDVAHNPARPFVVESGAVSVRALGTQFDVRRASQYVGVAVDHGLVAVSFKGQQKPSLNSAGWRVGQGQGIRVAASGAMKPMTPSQYVNATKWQRGVLEFDDDELGVIAEEFNRYNGTPKIYVDGEATHKRFSGFFKTRSPEQFFALVSADPAYEVVTERDHKVIRLKRKQPAATNK